MSAKDGRAIQFFIQYDGLRSKDSSIDLLELGESLQGFSKILACASNFASTGQFNRRYSSLNVSVSTNARFEEGCLEIPVWISSNIGELFSGFAGSVLTAVVAYVLSKRGKKEMEHLSNALNKALEQNHAMQERLLSTIDKMADGLVAASRQALSPIGKSCDTIAILDQDKQGTGVSANKDVKEHIERLKEQEITSESEYVGRISELDKLTGACKVSLDDDPVEMRVTCLITDPLLQVSGNRYVEAFASNEPIKFKAKAQLTPEGDIAKLFISDVVLEKVRSQALPD